VLSVALLTDRVHLYVDIDVDARAHVTLVTCLLVPQGHCRIIHYKCALT
jgi:hypothetical protein